MIAQIKYMQASEDMKEILLLNRIMIEIFIDHEVTPEAPKGEQGKTKHEIED